MPAKNKRRAAAPANKRRGLRRVECESCAAAVYLTFAQAELHGLPRCACGGAFTPDDVELAMALGLEDAPVVVEYRRKLSSVMHGQAWTGNYGVQAPDNAAHAYVERNRRERARSNRLGALKPAPEPMPF